MAYLVKTNKGVCVPYKPAALGPGSEYVMIREGVGRGGKNLPDEVTALRKALNKLPAAKGGTFTPLADSVLVDEELINAILRFKSMNTPQDTEPLFKHPQKATIVLNELLLESKQLVKTNAEVLPMMQSLIQEADACIRAAILNIELAQDAMNGLALPGVTLESRMALLNRHFSMDLNPNKRQSMDYLTLIFSRMRQVFQRPGHMWGSFTLAFDGAPPSEGWLAFTRAGGFFRNGEVEDGRRQDTIYLCELLRLSTRGGAIQTIVHELAHFCGPRAGETISDHGYGLPNDPRIKRLTPYLKLHNAECFGNFAWECKNGGESSAMV